MAMHTTLQPKYDALERRTAAFLARVAALTPAQRSFRPAPGAWSAVQVADHLARTERSVLQALEKGIPEHRRKRTLRHALAYPMVMAAMRLPIKVKAPLPEIVPEEERPLEVVESDWRAARQAIRAHLEGIGDGEVGDALILHPVAGPAGADKLLAFLDAHLRHHEFQLGRLLRHRDFPAA